MIKEELEGIGPVLRSQLLAAQAGVEHFCSMRDAKSPGRGVWMPRQVHGTDIVEVDKDTPFDTSVELQPVEADAVMTQEVDRWIGVRTADCVPALLYDPEHKAVAAVHAGWRGTVAHIVRRVVASMCERYGTKAECLYAVIGPSISPEAFEVGEEVARAFVEAERGDCVLHELWGERGRVRLPKPHVDLWQSNVMDLMEMGVQLERIDCTPWCTFGNNDQLFSARREGIGTGRIVSAICVKHVKND